MNKPVSLELRVASMVAPVLALLTVGQLLTASNFDRTELEQLGMLGIALRGGWSFMKRSKPARDFVRGILDECEPK